MIISVEVNPNNPQETWTAQYVTRHNIKTLDFLNGHGVVFWKCSNCNRRVEYAVDSQEDLDWHLEDKRWQFSDNEILELLIGSCGYCEQEGYKESFSYLTRLPYPEYLKTEHWQRTRKTALEYAKNRCQLCNSTTRLNVHHRTYVRIGREHDSDLTVLCANCHSIFHEKLELSNE